jgi:DNA-3-methyladenine glycosylase
MAGRRRLPRQYYQSEDVTGLARDLLGKYLVTEVDNRYCSGMIVETEAYRGPDDRACHAFNHRRTQRTEVLYAQGGVAYIYLCYGIHHLMNVVTAPRDTAHAILIRALQPENGMEVMADRRGMSANDVRLTKGPGALSQALGLTTNLSGVELFSSASPVWLEDRGVIIAEKDIYTSKRIGVAYAGEAAQWPWRYFLKDNKYVSVHRKSGL